jgi:hypothetical protein
MSRFPTRVQNFLTILLVLLGLNIVVAHAQVAPVTTAPIFADEFGGSSLDRGKWNSTGTYQNLQATQWGNTPTFGTDSDGTNFIRIPLDTYNPNSGQAGNTHLGTQLTSMDRWNLGTGLEYETRLRANNLPKGLVLGFFAYGETGWWPDSYQQSEIDYEFLTALGNDQLWLNLWDDWNPLRGGPNAGTTTGAGVNWNNNTWNNFKIRWYPDRTEWIVNNSIIRTERTVRVGSPMGVWLNIWAPNPPDAPKFGWGIAYDPAVTPTADPAQGRRYAYDVDYVRVRPIPKTTNAFIGDGTGLTGTYWDNLDLTYNLKLVRRDSRINFDWGVYAPDPSMGVNTFSTRWTGSVQAQFSETYTFTVRADDGMRLWVNNQLIVDKWQDGTASEVSGRIALQAGVKVPIRLEYYEHLDSASVQLFWSSASTPRQLVPQSQLYVAAQPAKPTFSPGGGTYYSAQNVTISSATTGATIRYTLDGSSPNESSPALAAGVSLSVSTGTVVRARAFVSGQVPSEPATASYVISSDTTTPTVAITAPAPNAVVPSLSIIEGTASDAETGVVRVDVIIRRLSDDLRWNGSAWVNVETGLAAVRNNTGSYWSVRSGLPSGANLISGSYEIKAVAYDTVGNVGVKSHNISVGTGNIAPQVSAPLASPTSLAPGQTTALSVDVTDANGAADLRYLHLMLSPVGASPSAPASGLWLHYNVVEQRLYAWNGSGWGNGIARGASGTLTTAQGVLNLNASSIAAITNGYRLNVLFTPNSNFTGTFILRALPQDTQPRSGWDTNSLREGSSVTIQAPNVSPEVSAPTASPTSLEPGQTTNLSVDMTDANGAADLRYLHLMLSPVGVSPSAPASGLWLHFNAMEQRLYAWNGSGWGSGIARGAIGTLTTAQGIVTINQSSLASIPNGYRVSVAFTPNSNYTGSFVLRALPQDTQPRNGWDVGALREGSIVTIQAPNIAPQVSAPLASPTSLAPGETTALSVDVTDANGAADLRYLHLMLSPVGASPSAPASGLWLHYNVVEQRLYAWNGSGWGNGIARGASGTLTTAQGVLNLNASSIAAITNGYRLNVLFTPNSNFTGTFILRALPQDTQPRSGWDTNSLREGSSVTIGASSTSASRTAPSGGSS